jgi:hypothetical protein
MAAVVTGESGRIPGDDHDRADVAAKAEDLRRLVAWPG